MDDYLDTIREQAAEFGAGWAGKYDDYVSVDVYPWTQEEWAAFQGHTWVERRIVQVKGRYFADLMNVFNPVELRKAQGITEAEAARGVVGKVVYRDNEQHHAAYVSDEAARNLQCWTGSGWKK